MEVFYPLLPLFSSFSAHNSQVIMQKNVPPWSAGLATRSVVGFVGAKVLLFTDSN